MVRGVVYPVVELVLRYNSESARHSEVRGSLTKPKEATETFDKDKKNARLNNKEREPKSLEARGK